MKIMNGGIAIDDRGSLTFVNDFDFKGVKRFYVVKNHAKGFVRAWHGHEKEDKYVFVVKGSIILGIVSMRKGGGAERLVVSAEKPQIIHIPKGNYNGFKTLTDDAQIIFYSTTTMEEAKDDDFRMPADKWDMWEVQER